MQACKLARNYGNSVKTRLIPAVVQCISLGFCLILVFFIDPLCRHCLGRRPCTARRMMHHPAVLWAPHLGKPSRCLAAAFDASCILNPIQSQDFFRGYILLNVHCSLTLDRHMVGFTASNRKLEIGEAPECLACAKHVYSILEKTQERELLDERESWQLTHSSAFFFSIHEELTISPVDPGTRVVRPVKVPVASVC